MDSCPVLTLHACAHLSSHLWTALASSILVTCSSHNIAKVEEHLVDGRPRKLLVHRKGATRAFGPHHPLIPVDYQFTGALMAFVELVAGADLTSLTLWVLRFRGRRAISAVYW